MNRQDIKAFVSRYATPKEAATALVDAADGVEKISYTRNFTKEQLLEKKHQLSNVVVDIKDIEIEKKDANDIFKKRLKEPLEQKELLTLHIKRKAEDVSNECAKFFDEEEKTAHYVDPETCEVVFSRPMNASEFQGNIFSLMRKEGSND